MTIALRARALIARNGRCTSPLRREPGVESIENGRVPRAPGMLKVDDMRSEARV